MKKITLLLCFAVFLISSCSKSAQEPKDLSTYKPEELKNVDFVKSAKADHVAGKMTIHYESGKVIVRDIPKDTSRILPRTESGPDGYLVTDNVFEDPAAQGSTGGGPGTSVGGGVPLNVQTSATVKRDGNDPYFILSISNFYARVDPPIIYYTTLEGLEAKRVSQIMGMSGTCAPMPPVFVPITITYNYMITCTYTWSNGTVFTRQYSYSSVDYVTASKP